MRFEIGGFPVGRLLQFNRTVTPNSIVNTALDGTPHIQIIGNPASVATVEVFAPTILIRDTIDLAAARGAAVRIEYHGEAYNGYISEAVSWKWIKKGVSAIGTFSVRVMDT